MAFGATSGSFILFLILILLVFGMGFCGCGVTAVEE